MNDMDRIRNKCGAGRENKAHLTAITRKTLSLPTAWLLEQGRITGEALDYGCGRGYDADFLGMDKYDPHYAPEMPTAQYDTVICNYVLNVIPEELDRIDVVNRIRHYLKPGGVAYISVRNDSFTEGYTSKGTWQGKVSVPWGTLIRKCAGYRMYRVQNDSATFSI